MNYDVIIIGAGPGGIYSAYELTHARKDLRVAVFETGNPLHKRKCPIDGKKIKSCIHCKTCLLYTSVEDVLIALMQKIAGFGLALRIGKRVRRGQCLVEFICPGRFKIEGRDQGQNGITA